MSWIEVVVATALLIVVGVLLYMHPRDGVAPGQCYTNSLGYTYKVLSVGEFSVAVCQVDTDSGACLWRTKWDLDYVDRRSRTDCETPQ